MNNDIFSALIDCGHLNNNLFRDNICILEVSINGINQSEIDTCNSIYNAKSFDIELFSNHNSNLPHTMIDKSQFEELISQYDIDINTKIFLYEKSGIYASPRAWWMFKSMGHKDVYILNSTISEWIKLGYLTSNIKLKSFVPAYNDGKYIALYDTNFFCGIDLVKKAIKNSDKYQIIDARSCKRFQGVEPEPRKGLYSGHIPNSINLPFNTILKDGRYVEADKIKHEFAKLDINHNKSLIFTCGSGVTACILALAAYSLGFRHVSVYDGSWSEWGQMTFGNPIGSNFHEY